MTSQLELPMVRSGLVTEMYQTALCSMDARTKIGAVVVTPSRTHSAYNRTLCHGPISHYDGLLTKHEYFEHAERLALWSMAVSGEWFPGVQAKLVVNEVPCVDCSRAICTAGISEVHICYWWFLHASIYGKDLTPKLEKSLALLKRNGVRVYFDDAGCDIPARRDDLDFVPNEGWFLERRLRTTF